MSSNKTHKTSLGDLTLTVLRLGEIQDNARTWFAPGTTQIADQVTQMPVNCLHVEGPGFSVLVDACDPLAYPVHNTNNHDIRTTLEHAGIVADSVTHVILTHGHHDHFCGVLDTTRGALNFPSATHLMSPKEWQGDTLAADVQTADGDRADPEPLETLFRSGKLDFDETCASLPPETRVIAAPGESKGHRVVHIASRGDHFFFLADLFHLHDELDTPALCPLWADAPALTHSRAQITGAIRETGARFICSHLSEIFSPNALKAPGARPDPH